MHKGMKNCTPSQIKKDRTNLFDLGFCDIKVKNADELPMSNNFNTPIKVPNKKAIFP
jgi:hypothetical protein